MSIRERLFFAQDSGYRDFHARLVPNIEKERIIGVRTPVLREIAKEVSKSGEAEEFLKSLPHEYYEENNLHAFLIEQIRDFDRALYETERFLPYIDNWATCDSFLPKVFKKERGNILPKIYQWLESSHTYTVRYGIGLLMSLFLDDAFEKKYLEAVCGVRSDEYYIKMMIAWYFATALTKQYDSSISYIEQKRLDPWTHNKTISKACDSRRISGDTKAYLKSLRIK